MGKGIDTAACSIYSCGLQGRTENPVGPPPVEWEIGFLDQQE